MLKRICFLSMMVLTLTIVSTGRASAQPHTVSIDYFYDQLSPYGHWESIDQFGWVWKPYGIRPGWRPYSDGYWVYTDYGWTYNADHAWGWAVYHYGRWAYLDYYGWVWIPGSEWGPAWVAWRQDDNYIVWAPLPPKAVWRVGVGIDFGNFNVDVDIHWSNWCFVNYQHFDSPRVYTFIETSPRNVNIIRYTRNITRYDYSEGRIVNRCFDVESWERRSRRRVEVYHVVEAPSYRKAGVTRSSGGNEMRIFRPQMENRQQAASPRSNENRQDLSSPGKYNRERKKYDKFYDKEYYKLVDNQRKELNTPNVDRREAEQRHDNEIGAYREQRSRDIRTIETRHVNDMDKVVRNPQKENTNTSRTKSTSNSNSSGRTNTSDSKTAQPQNQSQNTSGGRR
jgi:hypothetical protein